MPQEKPKKKTQVRESKPLAESPRGHEVPMSYDYQGVPSKITAWPPAKTNMLGKKYGAIDTSKIKKGSDQEKAFKAMQKEKAAGRAGGRTLKKEKFNRFGGSFTSDM
jgi:hypothetical protein